MSCFFITGMHLVLVFLNNLKPFFYTKLTPNIIEWTNNTYYQVFCLLVCYIPVVGCGAACCEGREDNWLTQGQGHCLSAGSAKQGVELLLSVQTPVFLCYLKQVVSERLQACFDQTNCVHTPLMTQWNSFLKIIYLSFWNF